MNFIWLCPSTRTPVPKVMKCTILVDTSLFLITVNLVCLIYVWEQRRIFFKEMHFYHMTDMATPMHKSQAPVQVHNPRVYAICNFAHYYYILSLYEPCPGVGRKCFKVALGVCFALKFVKRRFTSLTYLITLCKDVTFPLITKFKTNKYLSNLSVNRIPN